MQLLKVSKLWPCLKGEALPNNKKRGGKNVKHIRHDKNGRTWVRVGKVHRRRDGVHYIRYHWTCIA